MPFAGYANFAACVRKNASKSDPKAYCATVMRAAEGIQIWEAEVSDQRRENLAKKGAALPDGSFPIPSVAFLKKAIQAFGRAKNKAAAKAHIIKRARALGRTDLLPDDWKGSSKGAKEGMEPIPATEVVEATEAQFNRDDETGKMTARIKIIQAGPTKSKMQFQRVYSPAAIRRAAQEKIYDGLRMFVNHSDKPHLKRGLMEMVSAVESTEYDPKTNAVYGNVEIFDKDFFDRADKAKKFMGVSATQRIEVTRSPAVNGKTATEEVQRIPEAHSVDWVIYPAAGGEIIKFARESEGADQVEWDDITLDTLREHAPAVLDAHKQELAKESKKVDPPDDDDEADENEEDDAPVTMKKSDLSKFVQEQIQSVMTDSESKRQKNIAATKKVRDRVAKSGLPARTQGRIVNQFAEVQEYVEKDVDEAITEAQEEFKEAKLGPRISGMGPTSSTGATGSERKTVTVREGVEGIFGFSKKAEKKDDKATSGAASGKES